MQNPSKLQIEQLKLAKETSEVLLRDCPKHIQENVRSFYDKQILHLISIVDHVQTCEFDAVNSSCKCGYVTAKGADLKYGYRV